MMLQLYPEAVKIPDGQFSLAIHKAAQYANLDVIKLIHQAFPEGVKTADSEGLLPMHYVAQRDQDRRDNVEVMKYLLELNPSGEILNNNSLDFDTDDEDEEGEGGRKEKILKAMREAKEAASSFFTRVAVYAKKSLDDARNTK